MAKMQHIKQGDLACFPTVLAMLSGNDVNKIIAEAQLINPLVHSWGDAMLQAMSKPGDDLDMVYKALARKYAPYLIEHTSPVRVKDIGAAGKFMSYHAFISATATGRGAILLCSRFISCPAAHIAAFEQGIIFDPGLDGPIPAHDYYVWLSKITPNTPNLAPLCPHTVVAEY